MKQLTGKIGMDSFTLKMIAIVCMLIDHIGLMFFPHCMELRMIGRIAFPIFAYTLVEGFFYTHDVKKYILRMGVFALISELPFDLAIRGRIVDLGHQNVYFTLTLGLVMLYLLVLIPNTVGKIGMVLAMLLISEFLHTDYNSMGLLMILCFYLFRDRMLLKIGSIAVINIFLMGYLQEFGALAMIPVSFHNRQEGKKAKVFFYAFYPVHLMVLFLIRIIF